MESQNTLNDPTNDITEDDFSNDTAKPEMERLPRTNSFLEPPIFLLFFASSLSGTVFQYQVIYQCCTEIFHFNETECLLLGNHNATNATHEMEKTVEPFAAKIFMARTIVESLLPALVNLLLGPWSDKFGRKPLIVATFTGYFVTYVSMTVISYLSTIVSVNPWFYLLPFIPISICGGICTLVTGAFCHVADVSSQKNSAFRMAQLEAALYAGLVSGSMSSSYIFDWTSSTAVFGISALFAFLGVIYVIFLIGESIQQIDGPTSKLEKFKAIFDVNLPSEMIRTCVKRRENYNRSIIWMMITTSILSIFALEGAVTVTYLFVRQKFNWTIQQATFFDSANIVAMIIGNIVGMYLLSKVLRMSSPTIAIISHLSSVIYYVISSAASHSWHLYLAAGLSLLRGVSGPMSRSILANLVPAANEVGKIYSLTTSLESISPFGSAPLYSYIYSNTLGTFPGAFNVISAGLYSINCIFFLIVYIILRRYPTAEYSTVD